MLYDFHCIYCKTINESVIFADTSVVVACPNCSQLNDVYCEVEIHVFVNPPKLNTDDSKKQDL